MEDKEFVRQFTTVLSVLVVIALVIFVIAKVLTSFGDEEENPLVQQAIEERIRPVAEVYVGAVPEDVAANAADSASGGGLSGGKDVYEQVCAACHSAGVAGAPKFGDVAAWEPRLALGKDALYASVVNGKGAMPARGGHPDLTEKQIMDAVDYLLGEPSATESEAQEEVAAPSQETQVATAETSQPASDEDTGKGKEVYDAVCGNCHNSGVAGAPKPGDSGAWEPRLAQGKEALYNSALAGKGVMPAKGGRPDLSDEDVKMSVDYMLDSTAK